MSGKPSVTIGVPFKDRWRIYESRRAPRPPEFGVWRSMVQRCTNPKIKHFHNYGGRGIKVCKRWRVFKNFLADMGQRPSIRHTLERKKNNLGYYKANCKWATRREQAENRRDNQLVTFHGRTLCVVAWARKLGINANTLCYRLRRGWTVERALTT